MKISIESNNFKFLEGKIVIFFVIISSSEAIQFSEFFYTLHWSVLYQPHHHMVKKVHLKDSFKIDPKGYFVGYMFGDQNNKEENIGD